MRDISVDLAPGTPPWPGDTPFSCGWSWSMARGASVNVSAITMSPHVGTHADAPLHVRDGWTGAGELPLAPFAGSAIVWSIPSDDVELSTESLGPLLSHSPGPMERLLLRTSCSIAGGTFPDTWPVLSVDAVRTLIGHGLKLLGVDCPSVDRRDSTLLPVHHALFEGGACILENLDLRGVPDGPYELLALPIKLPGLDAAPVRAVLRDLSA